MKVDGLTVSALLAAAGMTLLSCSSPDGDGEATSQDALETEAPPDVSEDVPTDDDSDLPATEDITDAGPPDCTTDDDCADGEQCQSGTCGPPAECAPNATLELGVPVQGDATGGAAAVSEYNCAVLAGGDYSGPEAIYEVVATADGLLTVVLTQDADSGAPALDLALLNACDGAACAKAIKGADGEVSAAVQTTAGDTWFVVVDGRDGATGPFELLATHCAPTCGDAMCGDDGCGGSCGECDDGDVCDGGQCVCAPQCTGPEPNGDKDCGDDGCGGSCGECPPTHECDANGQCSCTPQCFGPEGEKVCGDDGCGETCGGCAENEACDAAGKCVCVPDCTDAECGDDGCGGFCGFCASDELCNDESKCVCAPQCVTPLGAKECGKDGCGGSCGECPLGFACNFFGQCQCVPQCSGPDGAKECGEDGCGGSCGSCEATEVCSAEGTCSCAPQCDGPDGPKQCGDNGCGGDCGSCGCGDACEAGYCVFHGCDSAECGTDGCGGSCGLCGPGFVCTDGTCELDICVPDCSGAGVDIQCGDDGCGGSCGSCACGETCDGGLCVFHGCDAKACGPNGCGGTCGTCAPSADCVDASCVACIPQCDGKTCGGDGCGGSCGACGCGETCEGGACAFHGCDGKTCGDDGCGGSCGKCGCGESCDEGACEPTACDDVTCGPDGCGGSCGTCIDGEFCAEGFCFEGACTPECDGKACGEDGCGGTCGACADASPHCVDGQCQSACPPDACDAQPCGFDLCGNPCGECPAGQLCEDAACVACVPSCGINNCGGDGCGGSCGSCGCGATCDGGSCVFHGCDAKVCGSNGCGDVCGKCTPGFECDEGSCIEVICTPDCADKGCGDDGCGGTCGTCGCGELCEAAACVFHGCDDTVCGDDGCGSNCGACAEGFDCEAGECIENICVPDCAAGAEGEPEKACGDDGCGGSCGACGCGETCQAGQCVFGGCQDKACGSDGCGGSCGECPLAFVCTGGTCVEEACKPQCDDEQACGDDGCGGSCGDCGCGEVCEDGACAFTACTEAACGDDGCGGSCGECATGEYCIEGQCLKEGECPTACGVYEYCDQGACVGGWPDSGTEYVWENPAVAPTMGWDEAVAYCDNLEFGGKNDWQLPSMEQLQTLQNDTGEGSCGWMDGLAGVCSEYWSSSVDPSDGGKGFAFSFKELTATPSEKTKQKSVRCVRNVPDCTIQCFAKTCGDDGCGGTCGACGCGELCEAGACNFGGCDGKTCGDDGCGGSCGSCGCQQECETGACVFHGCDGKECGFDGCGGTCGACPDGGLCTAIGTCCTPDCAGKECGGDGCGGICGVCEGGDLCEDGLCICIPDCDGKSCGEDGCGGVCGTCAPAEICVAGDCTCVPDCSDGDGVKECGGDGCGGSCGECPEGLECAGSSCICAPNCDGKDCGPDGCGGSCGACEGATVCEDGVCACVPQCGGTDGPKECGENGCGGVCGVCLPGEECQAGYCACVPSCEGPQGTKECGGDGCGGSCGDCPGDEGCSPNGICGCEPNCEGTDGPKDCGDDGCGGTCGGCLTAEVCAPAGTCVVPEPGDTCLVPQLIASLPYTVDADTSGAFADVSYGAGDCAGQVAGGGAQAPDHVYLATTTTDDVWVITLDASFDATLYASATCENPGAQCAGAIVGAGSQTLLLPVTAFSSWFLFVDGVTDGAGAYTLTVEAGGCIPDCDGKACGADGCGGSCGDCPVGKSCGGDGACGLNDGDLCVDAPAVGGLPFATSGDTTGAQDDYAYSAGDCPAATGGSGGGAGDLTWFFEPATTNDYVLTVTGNAGQGVYVVIDCASPGGSCVGAAQNAGGTATLTTELTAGTGYYVIVDGVGAGVSGPFDLAIEVAPCVPACDGKDCGDDGCGASCGACDAGDVCNAAGECAPPSGDTCADAIAVSELPFAASGDTTGAADDYSYAWGACPPEGGGWGFGAADRVYVLEAPQTGDYQVSVHGPFGATVYVVTDCAQVSSTCVAGNEEPSGLVGVTVELTAGVTYYVIVDGWGGLVKGSYDLTITPPWACAPTCAGKECGPDGCGGSCGACAEGACGANGLCTDGDTCAKAVAVGALPFITGTGDTTGATDDYSFSGTDCAPATTGAGFGAPDEVWSFTPEKGGLYKIGLEGAFDRSVYVVTDCADIGGTCLGGSTSEVEVGLTGGESYSIIVDGVGPDAEGAYTLTVALIPCDPDACAGKVCGSDGCGGSCGTCAENQVCMASGQCIGQPGDVCAGAPPIPSLPFEVAADTSEATDDYGYSPAACPGTLSGFGVGSPDQVWLLQPTAAGEHTITITGGFDPTVYVVTDCEAIDTECLGAAQGTPELKVILEADASYFIIVDGSTTGSGPYVLSVTEPGACTPDCSGKACGDDGCGGSCGTCAGDENVCSASGQCLVPSGLTCETAYVVGSLPFTANDDTSEATDDTNYGLGACPPGGPGSGFGSPDRVWRLDATQTGVHTIKASGAFGPALYVVTDCSDVDASCVGGEQSSEGPVTLELLLEAGKSYFVVVDGAGDGAAGAFELSIVEPGGCLPSCGAKACGDDGCGGSCGSCPADEVCSVDGACVAPDGDVCAAALPIGDLPFVGIQDTTDATDDYGYGWGACPPEGGSWGLGAPDQVWSFTPTVSGPYLLSAEGNFGATIYVVSDCADIDASCITGDEEPTGPVAVELDAVAGETYFVIIDGYGAEAGGAYAISVASACGCDGKSCGDDGCGGSCGSCAVGEGCTEAGACVALSGETCAEAPTVGALPFTITGDTTGAADDYNYGLGQCPSDEAPAGFGAPDRVWSFTPGATSQYTIAVSGGFASAVYVVTDCANAGGTCQAGAVDITGAGASEVTVLLSATTEYFIVIDGLGGAAASGGYTLTVESVPCPADPCDGKTCGPDGCGGSCGDCEAGEACSASGQCLGAPGGNTCDEAPVVDAVPFTTTGTTADATDQYSYAFGACPPEPGGWGFGSPDRVFRFEPPATGSYHISVAGAYGPTVYVTTDCADVSGACVAGDKQDDGLVEVTTDLEQGTVYYVVVDGWGALVAGDFTLTIEDAP